MPLIIEENFPVGQRLSTKVIDDLMSLYYIKENDDDTRRQAINTIHPTIGNTMYARQLEILENERMKTFVKLARGIEDNEQLNNILTILGYGIIQK